MSKGLSVNAMFTDHMVLQRGVEVPVWGEGADGAVVRVRCRGEQVETRVENGSWMIALPSIEAGGPFELIIESEGHSIVIRDVLFGDVWLAGGQSNMEWPLSEAQGGPAEIEHIHLPNLRYYDVPKVAYEDRAADGAAHDTAHGAAHSSSWKVCTPEHAGAFSAVAFYFARQIIIEQGVPIGIIGCNWGGTSASCWVPEHVLTDDSELRIYADEFIEIIKNFDPAAFAIEEAEHNVALAEFNRKHAAGLRGKELGDYPWPIPISPSYFLRPYGVYGTMLLKVVPFGLKGFLYYQGEGDTHRSLLYDKLMEALIGHWRALWNQPKLPFLFVQLPAFGCNGNELGEEWPLLRESQLIVTERVANTGMVVAIDCGEREDIHPINKKPVGERLALLALEQVYGQSVESSGPVFHSLKIADGKAILSFDHSGEGLSAGDFPLTGFEITDDSNVYVPAQAICKGNEVEVWSEQVQQPSAVRYGWANYTEANLVNSFGLPAGPFRTKRVRT
ncbi:sialate O-acetylesterase [Paenibacillus eucommiae]|uniref:Sialate O-acetylesterase n=1 Tax=Paenibacillus eucommiae TaxID=1355755 RepID=A0ABS4IZL0_9BACL|nr:sialate O-acetylesterase [Paenibacillus eucommiae]MBP1992985.1 sialate O-acetylesterase [Paenibacillus eucommiae]